MADYYWPVNVLSLSVSSSETCVDACLFTPPALDCFCLLTLGAIVWRHPGLDCFVYLGLNRSCSRQCISSIIVYVCVRVRARSVAIFLGVIASALGRHIPLVPAQSALRGPFGRLQASRKYQQPTKGPQEIATTIHGLCLLSALGILHRSFHWYLRSGAKYSPCQISPFKIFATTCSQQPIPKILKLRQASILKSLGILKAHHIRITASLFPENTTA